MNEWPGRQDHRWHSGERVHSESRWIRRKYCRSKKVAVYSGSNENEHSMEEMNKLVEELVVRKTLEEIILNNRQPDSSLYGDHTYLFIQPISKFIVSGVSEDGEWILMEVIKVY